MKLKAEDNCFAAVVIGCVALHVYKLKNFNDSQHNGGDNITKGMLNREDIINRHLKFIERCGP